MTAGQAWEIYVGAQPTSEWDPADVAGYVNDSPLCRDLDDDSRVALETLLREHIAADVRATTTLAVTWADGRHERHPVEIGGTLVLGTPRAGVEPHRIPIYRPDGPTIASCEVYGDELPAIVVTELAGPSLAEQLSEAIRQLEARRAAHEARWSECMHRARLALEAAERGDRERALALVEQAADGEYALCGDCDSMGKVEDAAGVGRDR